MGIHVPHAREGTTATILRFFLFFGNDTGKGGGASGALKFCRQGQHAVIPLFVKRGIVRGDDIDFLDASNLFYPNSQLNFNAPHPTISHRPLVGKRGGRGYDASGRK